MTTVDENQPLPLLIGGVLRCCIKTYKDLAPSAMFTQEGDTLSCSYCSSRLIVNAGHWGWDRDYDTQRGHP